jgi:hypothetical protein
MTREQVCDVLNGVGSHGYQVPRYGPTPRRTADP